MKEWSFKRESLPDYLLEDMDETERLRKIVQTDYSMIAVIRLTSQFDLLVNSLKCAKNAGQISSAAAAEIREEYSRY